MYTYTPVRRLKRIINTTSEGNQLFGGPYVFGRDLPVAGTAVVLAVSVMVAGFVAGKFAGLVFGLIAGCAILYYAAKLLARLRRADDGFTITSWIGKKIDRHFVRPSTLCGPNPFHADTAARQGSAVLPVVDVIANNIRLTPSGTYWAEYRVGNPNEMGLIGEEEQLRVLSEQQKLLKKLLQHGALIGQYKEPLTINELVERSFTEDDLEPDEIPWYAKAVTDSVDELVGQAEEDPSRWPHKINHILAFYVGKSAAEAVSRRDEIIENIPFLWDLQPATRQEMYWTWYAHCTNGAMFVSTAQNDIPHELPRVVVDDGALSDNIEDGKKKRRVYREADLSPVVKIMVDDHAPSYQAILSADLPDYLEFPDDTDCLSVLRQMGESINWIIRCSPIHRKDAQEFNGTAKGIIDDNRRELGDDTAYVREEALLGHYNSNLTDPTSNGVRYTLFVQVGAAAIEDVKRIANGVRDVFESMGILFNEPEAGKQEERWAAMQPGAAPSPEMQRCAAETTTGEFAELVPFTTAQIGHDSGPVIGHNLTSGLNDPVRLALEKLLLAGRAAIVAIVASLGGGKSTLGKLLAYFAHCRGYPWGAFDRSNLDDDNYPGGVGEWQKFADSLPPNDDGSPSAQTIDITRDPPGSFDPLKVWAHDPQTACRYTYNMHLQLEDLDEDQQLALDEALKPSELANRALRSQMALARYLINQTDDPHAVRVGRKIARWEWRSFAAAIFKEDLPALTLTATGTVIRTDGLTLPSERKVFSDNHRNKLTPEERYGPVIYLLGSLFLKSVFRQRGTIGFQFNDESWTITGSGNPIAMELFELDIRDGRKRGIIPVFMTHSGARDLKDEVFKLVTVTFLGRAERKELAISNAEWFGAMPVTSDVVNNLLSAKDGRFYMSLTKDDSGTGRDKTVRQVAEIQTTRPADPLVREAMNTNPKIRRANKGKAA
jgi:hypothetical protein